jgi:DNA polymerase III sliding clamp (beta) subunit (PCNA family)
MRFDPKYKPELCSSPDETRPHLTDVEFSVEDRCMVATDGHRLIRVPCQPEDGDTSGIITEAALKAARKAAPKRSTEAQLGVNGCYAFPGGTIERQPRGEQFPPWKRVIPANNEVGAEGTVTIALNARYLHEIANALGSKHGNVMLTFKAPSKPADAILDPIVIRTGSEDDDDAIALLMPVRR